MQITCIQVFNPENGLSGFQTAAQAQQTLNSLDRVGKFKALLQMKSKATVLGVHSNDPAYAAQVTTVSIPCYTPQYDLDGDEVLLPYAVVDSGGRRYFDVSFEKNFIVPTNEPDNLYYIVFTTINHGQLAADYGLQASLLTSAGSLDGQSGIFTPLASEIGALIGDINFATVYTNGNMKKTGKFFLTPGGDLYTGPKHFHPTQGYMAGAVHKAGGNDEEHFPLTVIKTENTKIQDFRQVNRMDDFISDLFYNFKKQIDIPTTIKMNSQDFLDIETTSYSSDPFVTFDSYANPRFNFSINMLQLARERFLYGGLLRKEPAAGSLDRMVSKLIFQRSYIMGMELYRQRVDGDTTAEEHPEEMIAELYSPEVNSAGIPTTNNLSSLEQVINTRDEKVSLGLTGEAQPYKKGIHQIVRLGKLPHSKNPHLGLLRKCQASIKDVTGDVRMNNTVKKINTFNITDLTAKSSPGASFKYRVKLLIKDGSVVYLKKLIADSLKHRKGIVDYLTEANVPGNFDPVKKQFTSSYRQRRQSATTKAVQNAIGSLTNLLNLAQESSPDNSGFLAKNTTSIINQLRPHVISTSGTPSGISTFLSVYDKILSKVIDMSGLKNIKLEGTAHTDKMFDSNGTFKEVVEISIPLKTGINSQADASLPALLKVPDRNSDILALSFFEQNFAQATNLEGISHHPQKHVEDVTKISKFITISSQELEDLRLAEIAKYYAGESSEPCIFNPGGKPPEPGGTTSITFNPYSAPPSTLSLTTYAIKAYNNNTFKGVEQVKTLISGQLTTKHKIRMHIALLRMIARKLEVNVSGITFNDVTLSLFDDIEQLSRSKRYLLTRIAASMGLLTSQSVLSSIAGSFQDFSVMTEDEDQNISKDALNQLGLDEHVQDGDNSFGVDLDNVIDSKTEDMLTYLIYTKVLFPDKKSKLLKSFNGTTSNNQYQQLVDREDKKDNFSNGVLAAQSKFVHYLPDQIKYLFLRDTKSTDGSEIGSLGAPVNDIFTKTTDDDFEGEALDYDNIPLFMLNNSSVYRLYYIEGYTANPTSNVLDMKNPVIKPLTAVTANSYSASGKTLICFMKKFEDSNFVVNLEDVLDVPVMNKYFMVQAAANAGQVDSSPTTENPPAEESFVPPFEGAALVPSDDAEELSVDNSGASIVIDNPTLGGYR